MTDDEFEKLAEIAAEQCSEAYFNAEGFMGLDSVQMPDNSFMAGAIWARERYRSEIEGAFANGLRLGFKKREELEAEVERLKELEWKYNDLCK